MKAGSLGEDSDGQFSESSERERGRGSPWRAGGGGCRPDVVCVLGVCVRVRARECACARASVLEKGAGTGMRDGFAWGGTPSCGGRREPARRSASPGRARSPPAQPADASWPWRAARAAAASLVAGGWPMSASARAKSEMARAASGERCAT